ncbi:MAG: 30S ribosomal protein S12 methylthiotransferase RimO [Akkermansia sp.]
MPVTVGLISLGCAKNLTDSEIMIGHLQKAGMIMTPEPDLADVVVVNTCSFIDKAKKESIDTILGVAKAKARGEYPKDQKLIVAGCLAQRFSKDLPALLPEVDAFIGLDQITQLPEVITKIMGGILGDKNLVQGKSTYIPEYDTPHYRLTPPHSAYIKIAEGCNHTCSFCVIPQIRGKYRSRSLDSIVREASMLIASGVKEINLIAQDSTYYGMDLWSGDSHATPRSGVDSSKGESLSSLLRALNAIEGDFWIRILYTHPAHWSNDLTQAIIECPKVARYVDIPLQHISDIMLTTMQRQTNGDYIRDLLRDVKAKIPDMAIRTTFITGFPGETEEDHQELLDFIEEFRFERAGIFTYSREEGTKAYKMPDQIHHKTKARRSNEASELLARIAEEIGQEQIGKTIRVLVESPGIARTQWDAPDIDGSVTVPNDLPVGEFAKVKITDAIAYDLVAEKAE